MSSGKHRLRFLAANSGPPWLCSYCGLKILSTETLLVHHKDHNNQNNDEENLMGMHQPCHIRHHVKGLVRSDSAKAKMAAAKRGRPLSQETKDKISASMKGVPKSQEHANNISIGKRRQHHG